MNKHLVPKDMQSELQKNIPINLFSNIDEVFVELDTKQLLEELGLQDEKLNDLELAKLLDEICYLTTKYVSKKLLVYVQNTLRWEQVNLKEYIQSTRGQEINNYGEDQCYEPIIKYGHRVSN